jgi:hypothetical protein
VVGHGGGGLAEFGGERADGGGFEPREHLDERRGGIVRERSQRFGILPGRGERALSPTDRDAHQEVLLPEDADVVAGRREVHVGRLGHLGDGPTGVVFDGQHHGGPGLVLQRVRVVVPREKEVFPDCS